MADEIDHWKNLAKRIGIERDGRALKRARAIRKLDWSDWTQEEKEVYAAAFMFPFPAEPLIDKITLDGVEMNLSRLSRTVRIVDEAGAVWLVIEHGRPEKMG